MKFFLSILLVLSLFFFSAEGQNPLTYRMVYDFKIGDEYEYRDYKTFGLPNGTRFVITGKYFSSNNDTVFYLRHFEKYSTSFNSNSPPYLDYSFSSGDDIIGYTSLDSSVTTNSLNWKIDSCNLFRDTLYNSSLYCGKLVYEFNACVSCCFEGEGYGNIYGEGIGLAFTEYSHYADGVDNITRLIYYSKSGVICGVPDSIFPLKVKEYSALDQDIVLYPSPTNNFIKLTGNKNIETIRISDIYGRVLIETKLEDNLQIDVSKLQEGIYFLSSSRNLNRNSHKFVVLRN